MILHQMVLKLLSQRKMSKNCLQNSTEPKLKQVGADLEINFVVEQIIFLYIRNWS